jgi:hypothetical protein
MNSLLNKRRWAVISPPTTSSVTYQFASYKEKLEKLTEFTTFRVNKMFPISFNTFKTLLGGFLMELAS